MAIMEQFFPSSIHVVIDLDAPVDRLRLATAWRRLPEQHPILLARARWRGIDTRWRPGGAPPAYVEVNEEPTARGIAAGPAERSLLSARLDPEHGPIARLAVLRRGGGQTRLLITGHHAAMDARATAMLADDLRRSYLALARDPDARPDLDRSPRSFPEVLRRIGPSTKTRAGVFGRGAVRDTIIPRSRHVEPWTARKSQGGELTYEALEIDPELTAALAAVRRQRGWTVNDVLLGLLARGWGEVMGSRGGAAGPTGPSCWAIAVDLRPWVGASRGMGNLSGIENVVLPDAEGRGPAEAVEVARREMEARKAGWMGLHSQLVVSGLRALTAGPSFEAVYRLGMKHRIGVRGYSRIFTNPGPLPDELGEWGAARAKRAYVVAPISGPPNTIFAASGFRGAITLCLGYERGAHPERLIRSLSAHIARDLEELAYSTSRDATASSRPARTSLV